MPTLTRDHPAVVTVTLSPRQARCQGGAAASITRGYGAGDDRPRRTDLTPDICVTGLEQHPAQGGRDAA
jgi:hypothetical protein